MKKTSTQQGKQRGQEFKTNWYCPECHAAGTPHQKGCTGVKVPISATARLPRKNATPATWRAFYRKFVMQEDLHAFRSTLKRAS